MAFSRIGANDSHNTGSGGTVTTLFASGSTTAGNTLIAAVWGAASPTTAITMAGWTLALQEGLNSTSSTCAVFYKESVGDISATAIQAAGSTMQLALFEFSGGVAIPFVEVVAGKTSGSASSISTTAISTIGHNDLIFKVAAQNNTNGGSAAWGGGSTLIANLLSQLIIGQYLPGTALTNYTDTATWTTGRTCACIIVAFSLTGPLATWPSQGTFSAHGLTARVGVTPWAGHAALAAVSNGIVSPSTGAFSGHSALSVAGLLVKKSVGTFSGHAALSFASKVITKSAYTIASAMNLSLSSNTLNKAIWSPKSTFLAAGKTLNPTTATLSGHGSFGAVGASLRKSPATFSPHSSAAMVGHSLRTGTLTVSPHASLAAAGKSLNPSVAAISGHGSLSFVGKTLQKSVVLFSPKTVSSFFPLGRNTATFSARAIFAAAGNALKPGVAAWSGHGTFAAVGAVLSKRTVALTSSVQLSVIGKSINKSSASISAHILFAAAGRALNKIVATFSPKSTFAIAGTGVKKSTASFASAGRISFVSSTVRSSVVLLNSESSINLLSRILFQGTATWSPSSSVIFKAVYKTLLGTFFVVPGRQEIFYAGGDRIMTIQKEETTWNV